MSSGIQSRSAKRSGTILLPLLAALVMPLAMTRFAAAQINGIPPSVTSIPFHVPPFLPNARPSVTSLGPNGFVGGPAFPPFTRPFPGSFRRPFFGRRGFASGAVIAPVFVPAFDPWLWNDSGDPPPPNVSSGPPTEQTLHIVVDLPTTKHAVVAEDEEDTTPPFRSKREGDGTDAREPTPIEPTVLVFRDGHKQEVTNYAIMGQTLWVFDARTQKFAVSDLDVPATVKANDDRGVDFQVPKAKKG